MWLTGTVILKNNRHEKITISYSSWGIKKFTPGEMARGIETKYCPEGLESSCQKTIRYDTSRAIFSTRVRDKYTVVLF